MFSDAAIAAVLLASSRHFSRHFWSFAPLLRPLACLQAHSSLRRQQLVAILRTMSNLTAYKWETGAVHPRDKKLARLQEVLKMGPRQVQKALKEPQE